MRLGQCTELANTPASRDFLAGSRIDVNRPFLFEPPPCSLRRVVLNSIVQFTSRMRLPEILQRRHTWHLLIGVPLLIGVLAIAGCSSRFVYNRLDTLATWYLESLVSLNDAQRSELKSWLESTLAWHRQSELARYAAFVNDVSISFAQPQERATYDAMRERFQGLLADLVKQTAPEASQLLSGLSPQQVEELLENMAEKTRDSTEESAEAVAENEWRPEQTRDLVRQVKRWTGAVTPEQKRLIAQTVEQLEPTYEEWAESQQAWRDALRAALMTQTTSETQPPPGVVALLEKPSQHWTTPYSQKVARNRERYQQLLMDLDATLTAGQRQHLRAELTNLAQQLTRLANG
jgi:Family of unknown function (DUF6279)